MIHDREKYLDASNGLMKFPCPLKDGAKFILNEAVNGLSHTVIYIFAATSRLNN